ncbi:MAG: HD family hydrolase [Hyphomicrobiales bacterium]|nr:HD family hydrolase [Hyphomicrobiales bacterium]
MPDRPTAPPRAWQRMLSGRRLDLLDPSPLDVEIADIAHGLARVARWNGQTIGSHAFSVAQHTLLVDRIIDTTVPDMAASGHVAVMLHDAPEYVIGDLISPFKVLLGGRYREIEQRLLDAIHLRFGVKTPITAKLKARIKAGDRMAAYFEATTLAGFAASEAAKFFGRPRGLSGVDLDLDPWPAEVAEQRFLERFATLTEMTDQSRESRT